MRQGFISSNDIEPPTRMDLLGPKSMLSQDESVEN